MSPRIPAKIPLVAEGRDASGMAVREETDTILVNEAGALIALAAELGRNDHCRVTNQTTGAAVLCRITWRSSAPLKGRWSYGIALMNPPDDFWGLKK